ARLSESPTLRIPREPSTEGNGSPMVASRPATHDTETVTSADDVPRDAIAVVGMAGRFPGAANPEELWELLVARRCAIRDLPPERRKLWDPAGLGDGEDPRRLRAGYLEAEDRFDPEFFGISPREAGLMDPQQRLFLEEA